jgi:hypothetical protein
LKCDWLPEIEEALLAEFFFARVACFSYAVGEKNQAIARL